MRVELVFVTACNFVILTLLLVAVTGLHRPLICRTEREDSNLNVTVQAGSGPVGAGDEEEDAS